MFRDTIDHLKSNKARRERGEIIAIPFPFPRFSEYVPGIERGRYIITTASSKVGKTKLTDNLFVYNPLNFKRSHGIKLKIFYFSLEMSKQDKELELLSHQLHSKTGIILSTDQLSSVYSKYITQDEIIKILEEEILPDLEDYTADLEIIDNIRNPYGIYKHVRNYANNNGRYFDKDNKEISLLSINNTDKTIRDNANKAIAKYVPNDPDEYVIIITDHISLLTPEEGDKGSIKSAMEKFSSTYSIAMRDRWQYTVVNVQQQAAAQEGVDNVKASMVRPSPNGLGDSKLTGRDVDMLLGLFSPSRLQIDYWEGYNIGMSENMAKVKKAHPFALLHNYREFGVCFSRRGYGDTYTNLFFNGASNFFKELPRPDNHEALNVVAQEVLRCQEAAEHPNEHVRKMLKLREKNG